MLSLILSFLCISQNETNISNIDRGCGYASDNIFFINNHNDINVLKDCNTINGSLFINGDYNIISLENFSRLEYITGYLLIYDSHTLKSLKGLNNLKYIYSENSYLLDYGVTVKYNNDINNNNTGLCFSNTVNWNLITPTSIIVSDNRLDCPTCHSECNGCFGPSRFLCQSCINYKSGDACVLECPNGTILQNDTCIELQPIEPINLSFNRLQDEYILNISWNSPNMSNGYIIEYKLFRGNLEIYNSFYNTSGYYSNDYLTSYYIDYLDNLDRNYEYKIAYSNSIGTCLSDSQNYFMYNRIPHNIDNLDFQNVTNCSVIFEWSYDNYTLVPIFEYSLNNSIYFQIINFTQNNNHYLYLLDNLNSNTEYYLSLRAKYNNFFTGNNSIIYFTTLDNIFNFSSISTTTTLLTTLSSTISTTSSIETVNTTIPIIPGVSPHPDNEIDNNFNYLYIILICVGVLILILILYYLFCCTLSKKGDIYPNLESSNETRAHNNPIYEPENKNEILYGDFVFNQRDGSFINSCYTSINYQDTVESNSLEHKTPTRKLTKRRLSEKTNDTMQNRNSLIEEIRERVPDMVPKNMVEL